MVLTEKQRLAFCKQCQNKKFDASQGIVCSLTDQKPAFEYECVDFLVDQQQIKKEKRRTEMNPSDYKVNDEDYKRRSNWSLVIRFVIGLFRIFRA
jgi:hypothetical protein